MGRAGKEKGSSEGKREEVYGAVAGALRRPDGHGEAGELMQIYHTEEYRVDLSSVTA